MTLAPVSTDLLIKLALVAAGIGLAVYLVRRTSGAAGEAIDRARAALADTADAVIIGTNPVDPNNYANRAVTAVGGALVSDTGPGRNADGSSTVGGWLYDITHADPMKSAPAANGDTNLFGARSEEIQTYDYLSGLRIG